jgi:hypothetical protein
MSEERITYFTCITYLRFAENITASKNIHPKNPEQRTKAKTKKKERMSPRLASKFIDLVLSPKQSNT